MNWSQLRAVLWLRWRLTRNQTVRSGWGGAVLLVIIIVGTLALGLSAGICGVIGGLFGLEDAPPVVLLVVWDVIVALFLFFWLLGVMVEIQRSESIDLGKLLHLPISLEGVFVVNYLASHLTFGTIIFVPGILALCGGLAWSRGAQMLLLIPLALAFIFMVTAWTYCLRGWLVTLMVNPRRRRNVIMGVTFAFVLLGQLPNLYFNVYLRNHHSKLDALQQSALSGHNPLDQLPPAFFTAHACLPVLWLPKGAMALATGNAWPAVWGSLGAFLLGAAGLARAYRSTMRFYRGEEKVGPTQARVPARAFNGKRTNFLERRLPLVSEEVAALALAFLRCLGRAPEVRMALAMNAIVIVILAGTLFTKHSVVSGPVAQLFVATGAVGFTFLGMIQLMFNSFGTDRDGFRALVLLPARRSRVLLAKNLALAPVSFVLGLALLGVLGCIARLPAFALLAGCLQLAGMFLLLSVAGNFISIVFPFRVSAGTLKPTKPPLKVSLVILLTHLFFPLVMSPMFVPPLMGMVFNSFFDWPSGPVNAAFSLVILALAALGYLASLEPLGRLLDRREQRILLVVSTEVE